MKKNTYFRCFSRNETPFLFTPQKDNGLNNINKIPSCLTVDEYLKGCRSPQTSLSPFSCICCLKKCANVVFSFIYLQECRVGPKGGYSPPHPPWHTIFIFFCHRYEKVKQGPHQNKVDEIRGVFIFGGRLAFISNFELQPPDR